MFVDGLVSLMPVFLVSAPEQTSMRIVIDEKLKSINVQYCAKVFIFIFSTDLVINIYETFFIVAFIIYYILKPWALSTWEYQNVNMLNQIMLLCKRD